MFFVVILIAIVLVVASVMGKPQTRLFLKEKVEPSLKKGIEEIRKQKDQLLKNPKNKIWLYVAIGIVVLIILAVIM